MLLLVLFAGFILVSGFHCYIGHDLIVFNSFAVMYEYKRLELFLREHIGFRRLQPTTTSILLPMDYEVGNAG